MPASQPDFWTAERLEMLARGAARGRSFSEIAAAIGDGCTRGMVAGKANRLGIPVDGRRRFYRERRKRITQQKRERLPIVLAEAERLLKLLKSAAAELGVAP